MPSKIQLDENLLFLYKCIQNSDLKTIDFNAVGGQTGLNAPAARMRYARLKKRIEEGTLTSMNGISFAPIPTTPKNKLSSTPKKGKNADKGEAKVTGNVKTSEQEILGELGPTMQSRTRGKRVVVKVEDDETEGGDLSSGGSSEYGISGEGDIDTEDDVEDEDLPTSRKRKRVELREKGLEASPLSSKSQKSTQGMAAGQVGAMIPVTHSSQEVGNSPRSHLSVGNPGMLYHDTPNGSILTNGAANDSLIQSGHDGLPTVQQQLEVQVTPLRKVSTITKSEPGLDDGGM